MPFVPTAPGFVAGTIPVADLIGGLAGQVVQGTVPSYAYPPGFEIAYDQITATVNVASTSEAAPTAIIPGTSHAYEAVPYMFQFYSPIVTDSSAANSPVTILLIEDGVSIGRLAYSDSVTVTTQLAQELSGGFRFTPTAAAHTFGISAFAASVTGTPSVAAGAGGINTFVPAFLRVTKC